MGGVKYKMSDNQKNKSSLIIFFCVFVFMSFFSPRVFSDVKAGMLVFFFLCSILIALSSKSDKKHFSTTAYKFIIIYSIYSIGNGLFGYFNRNPGSIEFFRVNVLYYIVLWSFCTIVDSKEKIFMILKICILSAFGVAFYSLALLAQNKGFIHISDVLFFDKTSMVADHEGYLHTTNTNLSMLIFLYPLILFLSKTNFISSNKNWRFLCIASVVLSALAIMISGRRAIFIVALASSFFYLFFRTKDSTRNKIRGIVKTILLLGTVFLILYYVGKELGINSKALGNRIESAFADEDEYGRSNARLLQMQSLFDGFLKNPIFGSGVGIGVDYIRSEERPWRYELSYNLLLYNAGIVGTILYFWSFFTIAKGLAKSAKSDAIGTALFVAYLCAIFANATNPYISSSFDFLWWVFIPLYYINFTELNEDYVMNQPAATQEDSYSTVRQ